MARLYPAPIQLQKLDRQGHTARALWNLLHEWYSWGGRGGSVAKRPSYQEMDRQLRDARSRPLPGWEWLAQLPAQASQQVLRHYLRAWERCFKGLSGPPRFKHRTSRMAVDVPQAADLRVVHVNRRWARSLSCWLDEYGSGGHVPYQSPLKPPRAALPAPDC
jgi:putative transposase